MEIYEHFYEILPPQSVELGQPQPYWILCLLLSCSHIRMLENISFFHVHHLFGGFFYSKNFSLVIRSSISPAVKEPSAPAEKLIQERFSKGRKWERFYLELSSHSKYPTFIINLYWIISEKQGFSILILEHPFSPGAI